MHHQTVCKGLAQVQPATLPQVLPPAAARRLALSNPRRGPVSPCSFDCDSTHTFSNQQQAPWMWQQQLELLTALQQPAQQLHEALAASKAAVHQPDRHKAQHQAHFVSTAAGGSRGTLVIAAAAAITAADEAAMLTRQPALAEFNNTGSHIDSYTDSSSSTESLNSHDSSSNGRGAGDLRERLRRRVATRTGSTPPVATDPPHQHQQQARPPAAGANNNNDSNIASVLQQLQQRMNRGTSSKPGLSTSNNKSTSGTEADVISSSNPAAPMNPATAATATAATAAAGHPAVPVPASSGSHQQRQKPGKHGGGALSRSAKTTLNRQKRSAKAFAALQQEADAALHAARLGSASNSSSGSKPKPMARAPKQKKPAKDLPKHPQTTTGMSKAAAAQNSSSNGGSSGRLRRKAVDADILTIFKATQAPPAVQQRLEQDWRAGRLPVKPELLQRRIMGFHQVQRLLGGPEQAAEIVSRDGLIMAMHPQILQRRLHMLQHMLGTDEQQQQQAASAPEAAWSSSTGGAVGAAAAEPPDEQQQQQQQEASAACVMVSADVLALVRSHPGVLRISCGGLQARLSALQQQLGLSSPQEALQVVRWQPRVLSMSGASLEAKVWALAAVIRVPPASIQDLFARQPLLMNLSAKTLAAKTKALQEVMGYSGLQLWQMLSAKPGVLLFAPEKLAGKWTRLQALAATSARWRGELQLLTPSSLVNVLTFRDSRLMRLQYMAAVGAQDEQSLYYTAVGQSDARFKVKFPGFAAWAVQQQQQQEEEQEHRT